MTPILLYPPVTTAKPAGHGHVVGGSLPRQMSDRDCGRTALGGYPAPRAVGP